MRSIGHAHVNNDRSIEDMLTKALERFPDFDSAFYLTANQETRLACLAIRANQSENDKLILKDPKKFLAIDDVAQNISVDRFGAKVIDTTILSEGEVQAIIEQEID